jgi:hypothetical protein
MKMSILSLSLSIPGWLGGMMLGADGGTVRHSLHDHFGLFGMA